MPPHFFVAGVPATGKTLLGNWLQGHGYVHIDAEKNSGNDFDRAGVHGEWNELIATGRAGHFVRALNALGKPVIVNWGFPTCFMYVVTALQAEGVHAWWLTGGRSQARAAFVACGGADPQSFDRQMDDIERNRSLIALVFGKSVVAGLRSDGSQRMPEGIWSEISKAG